MRFALAVCATALLVPANPAEAKAGDAAWAQCVQAGMPREAAAWAAMPRPNWQTPFTSASVLLGHKLIAGCSTEAANPLKPNREPNWRALAAALKRAKPGAVVPAVAEVALCQSMAAGEGPRSPFLYEIVRRQGGGEVTSFRQYMTEHEGDAVKLPQDLRMLPQPGTAVERTCRPIGADGSLG